MPTALRSVADGGGEVQDDLVRLRVSAEHIDDPLDDLRPALSG